jgi:malate dehydrogenase (oxaloacetate-decarboxylating)(NADP+)
MSSDLNEAALNYHKFPRPGKVAITPTKPMVTQRDLALAYSPGVAEPCRKIADDPSLAADYTSRSNMVAVISNGTAVLGLGDIGPLASKPVMEGKAVLFKKFAHIDAIDLEVDEKDPDKLVTIVKSLEASFGGINLEDIKAPECFEIERRLRDEMDIPVFHDDQHGTAVIVAAGILNWLRLTDRDMGDIKIVVSGAGASAIACLNILSSMGLKKENIVVCDSKGVIYQGRPESMDEYKQRYATPRKIREIGEALAGADLFLGLSVPGVIDQDMVKTMAEQPMVMALANPTPEIMPERVKEVRNDAFIATGRSDYPNQVNNVLCFPFIFRGALDVSATSINEEIKVACVTALADLAQSEATEAVMNTYEGEELQFGPEYLIPKPFDRRLMVELPIAVARAAMESGVAARPIDDFEQYRHELEKHVFQSSMLMRPVFSRAKSDKKRIAFAEGEEERVLRAAQSVVDDNLARPILIGREKVVRARIRKLGLRLRQDHDFELVNPEDDPRYQDYWQSYHELMARKGVTPDLARTIMRTNTTAIGGMLVKKSDADGLICGTVGKFDFHYRYIHDIIGKKDGVCSFGAMNVLILQDKTFFFCDTYVNQNPDARAIAEITKQAAEQVRRFGITPKVALLSHSNFGTHDDADAVKMRQALQFIQDADPDFDVDGEMHGDAALNEAIRERIFPGSHLSGQANLLVMPTVHAANISYNLIKTLWDAVSVGPLLLGADKPVHILTPSSTVRGIVNVTALAATAAQSQEAIQSSPSG